MALNLPTAELQPSIASKMDELVPVAIVDDNADDRALFELLVRGSRKLRVAGSYAKGEDALKSRGVGDAKVVLMDLRMPGMGGIECTRLLKKLIPSLTILIVTSMEEPDTLWGAILAGADGILSKPFSEAGCSGAILCALAGGMPLAKWMLRRAISSSIQPPAGARLTGRQDAILKCAARSMSNKEIADELHLSLSGVKKSFHAILVKLDASSRSEAVIRSGVGIF